MVTPLPVGVGITLSVSGMPEAENTFASAQGIQAGSGPLHSVFAGSQVIGEESLAYRSVPDGNTLASGSYGGTRPSMGCQHW